ncbi:MAG: glycosyltransferase family 2 protein [Planctomycetota bacterium]
MTARPSNPPATDLPSAVGPPVSVVILTLNEAVNLPATLRSCAWCDDIAVLDSGSADDTVKIAEDHGVATYINPFESFAKQRNWAIDQIPLKHDWVFHLDADEHFTPELVAEVRRCIAEAPEDVGGFHVPHRLMLHGHWLKRAGGYPVYQMRLFHKQRMRFIDHGHGQREDPSIKTQVITQPYLHFAFNKGLDDWLVKHNRYARQEALQLASSHGEKPRMSHLFARNPLLRRRALKALAYRLPGRASIRFWAIYLLQRGFLDGRAGYTYARMMQTYEHMIDLHRAALQHESPTDQPGS